LHTAMIRRRLQAGQLMAEDKAAGGLPTHKTKKAAEGFPRRLPLLQPIRLFGIPN
jgi:hypothetical protein